VHGYATIYGLLEQAAESVPERPALHMPGTVRTYAELRRLVDEQAARLLALGVGRTDRVGLYGPNSATYLELLLAVWSVGAVAVPVNARFRDIELQQVLPQARLSLLLADGHAGTDGEWIRRLSRIPLDVPLRSFGATPGGAGMPGRLEDTRAEGFDRSRLAAARDQSLLRDASVIFFTSGTTAAPKGCVLSQEALVRQGLVTAQRLDHRDGDVLLSPLPMFHTGCPQLLLAMLARRGTYVTMETPNATQSLQLIRDAGVTVAFTAFPAITEDIVGLAEERPEVLSGIRSIFSVGSPDQLALLQARLSHTTVVNGYGMTEFAGSIVQTSPHEPLELRLDQGAPLPGVRIRILGADGEELPPGEIGMIAAWSPTLFDRYLDDDDHAATFTPDGLFLTGDMGSLDERGRLRFHGRDKDMLKVGGENVSALEIESYLTTHPEVVAAAVIGVPDARLGEVPVAFVERRPDAAIDPETLIGYCSGAIASFKVPRAVYLVEEWPMSATKIQKNELRRLLPDGGDR
jgi:fatty-acyl-CoA synthase